MALPREKSTLYLPRDFIPEKREGLLLVVVLAVGGGREKRMEGSCWW
jgi:hypothetical protein